MDKNIPTDVVPFQRKMEFVHSLIVGEFEFYHQHGGTLLLLILSSIEQIRFRNNSYRSLILKPVTGEKIVFALDLSKKMVSTLERNPPPVVWVSSYSQKPLVFDSQVNLISAPLCESECSLLEKRFGS